MGTRILFSVFSLALAITVIAAPAWSIEKREAAAKTEGGKAGQQDGKKHTEKPERLPGETETKQEDQDETAKPHEKKEGAMAKPEETGDFWDSATGWIKGLPGLWGADPPEDAAP